MPPKKRLSESKKAIEQRLINARRREQGLVNLQFWVPGILADNIRSMVQAKASGSNLPTPADLDDLLTKLKMAEAKRAQEAASHAEKYERMRKDLLSNLDYEEDKNLELKEKNNNLTAQLEELKTELDKQAKALAESKASFSRLELQKIWLPCWGCAILVAVIYLFRHHLP